MNWRLGVVGSPIAHSMSPLLHERGLELANLEGSSDRLEMNLEGASALPEVMGERFDALSVTSPLKYAAFQLCDELSDVAQRTQSVNSLLWRDDKLHGVSTDGEGFLDALEGELGAKVENAHVVVLGAGGAASAIIDALVHDEVATVVVHGRNEAKLEEFASRYRNVFSASLVYRPVDFIINTLPAAGRENEAAVLQGVHPETIAVDITYEPRYSEWRQRYENAGCRTMNGLPMLAYQAALQMNWWWGVGLKGAQLLEVLQ
jgi:shikimate dehydrogenase